MARSELHVNKAREVHANSFWVYVLDSMVHMERDDNVKDVIVRNPEANVGRYHLRD